MWFAYFLNYSDRQAIFAMVPVLKSDLSFTDSQVGLIGSVFLWIYGFGCPVAGLMADRFPKRWLVIGSLAIWSIVTTLTGLVNTVAMMLVLRAAMGISESMYMPAAISLTASAHAPHQRSRAVAILTTAQIVGTFAGGTFGGWMAGLGQWRMAFFILGGIGLLYAVPYWLFLRTFKEVNETAQPGHSNEHAQAVVDKARPAVIAPTYILLCCVFPVFVFGLWMLYAWLPNFMFEKFELSLARAAFLATFTLQLTMFLGLIAGGAIADSWFKVDRAARLWLLVLSLLVCGPSLHFLGNCDSIEWTIAASGVFGFLGGFFAGNIFPAAFEVVAPNRRASAVGWLNFFGSMLSGFAPLVGGLGKSTIGIEGLLSLTAVAYFIAAVVLTIGICLWYQQDYQRVH